MVVSPFGPRSSQYTFGCLSPSDWEKGKNWKRLPFSGVYIKQHFLQPLVHSIVDFWGGVFNIRLLVSLLPVTSVHWENERQNTLKLYLLIEGCSHITSAQMCSLILGKGRGQKKKKRFFLGLSPKLFSENICHVYMVY